MKWKMSATYIILSLWPFVCQQLSTCYRFDDVLTKTSWEIFLAYPVVPNTSKTYHNTALRKTNVQKLHCPKLNTIQCIDAGVH